MNKFCNLKQEFKIYNSKLQWFNKNKSSKLEILRLNCKKKVYSLILHKYYLKRELKKFKQSEILQKVEESHQFLMNNKSRSISIKEK